MAKQSFADILDKWDRMQESTGKTKSRKPEKVEKKSKGFAEIYEQWENTHDERAAIQKRHSSFQNENVKRHSINSVRRMDAQDELDLHEMNLEEALVATKQFLDRCYKKGFSKVRIITGKGIHSKSGESVLRPAVTSECRNHPHVREIAVPKAAEGGSGALIVIFKNR